MKVRKNRTQYTDGYNARKEGAPIPSRVSRAWADGYRAAWLDDAAGRGDARRAAR